MPPSPPQRRRSATLRSREHDDDGVAGVPASTANQLLLRLPPAVYQRLRPHLHQTTLESQHVLFRAGEPVHSVYFPTSAVVSLVTRVETGQTLEVGFVGSAGLVGGPATVGSWGCDAVVEIGGLADRMDITTFGQERTAHPPFDAAIDQFSQLLLVRCIHIAACNMFHSAAQRCIRWLLTMKDFVRHDEIPLTHEVLASKLGMHRPTVSHVLGGLQRQQLIRERRGRVTIVDRAGLDAIACECYGRMRNAQQQLLRS
jgi:CRP-like cAMP-binding protein